MTDKALILQAIEARKNAYTPYSHFRVGAALLAEDGTVYQGCNVENAAYTPTNCAERTAFFKAVSEGKRRFSAIAIVAAPEGKPLQKTAPCGVCRQVLYEFCDESLVILCGGTEENYMETTLGELLPKGFRL